MTTYDDVDLVAARRSWTPTASAAEAQRNYDYDRDRFLAHSSTTTINDDPAALASFLTSAAHSLEKGLTMEVPRAGFGERKLRLILAATAELEDLGHPGVATEGARGCIQAYVRYHDVRALPLPAHLETELRAFAAESGDRPLPGGSLPLTRREIEAATDFDYAEFVRTRRSVRHFTGDPVSPDAVRTAVEQAVRTPRTCNRETRRVYATYEPAAMEHLLAFHHGNRGFGHKLGAVLVVTVDLREFDMIGERNQPWIDGGLFAMSLIYALHAAGLGTCMLNWSEDREHDELFRREFDLPDHEVIITFIGVGHVPEVVEVAASPGPTADGVMFPLFPR